MWIRMPALGLRRWGRLGAPGACSLRSPRAGLMASMSSLRDCWSGKLGGSESRWDDPDAISPGGPRSELRGWPVGIQEEDGAMTRDRR